MLLFFDTVLDTMYVLGTSDGKILLRHVDGETLERIEGGRSHQDVIHTVLCCHSPEWILFGGEGDMVRIWDRNQQCLLYELKVNHI
jgi:WD40 repeat protein